MRGFPGKVAVVTAAASDIDFGLADRFTQVGFRGPLLQPRLRVERIRINPVHDGEAARMARRRVESEVVILARPAAQPPGQPAASGARWPQAH